MNTRTIKLITVFILAMVITPPTFGAVGRTAGSADVSSTGEASYSIPIFAPPGTHGMAPRLALVYGHRNASSLLGAGWSIAGLSAITRCQKNWAADGEARAVLNDYSDRFCLDGNKLRRVTGTYGHASATYRTEIETFARITSYGTAGNGPTHFILETRDGIIYEYGSTSDSRIESVGQTTARAWALNQIRDQSGNAINFVYAEDTTNGAYRIDSVQYTSNVGQALASAYEIDFVWQSKPSNEIDSGYIAGSKVKQIMRLDRIDVVYNLTTLVRRYELTYESALSSTSKSRLASIQECAGTTPDCFAATTFSYHNGTSGLGTEVSMSMNMPTDPWPMDVNGDGRKDLVYSSHITSGSGTWMVMLANSSGGYNAPTNTGVTNTNYTGATPIDYNADGLEDLLVPHAGGTWWVMEGSASGLGSITNIGTTATFGPGNVRAFDVNGDGRDDLVWAELVGYAGGDSVRYRLRESSGTFSSTVSYLAGPLAADSRIETNVFGSLQNSSQRVPDFNGDGRGDMVIRRTTRQLNPETGQYTFTRFLDAYITGAGITSVSGPNAAGAPTYGDFNGDDKSDLLYLAQAGGLWARFGTGTGLTTDVNVGGGGAGWAILDWDGDGYDDVLIPSGSIWQLRRSTGESFAAIVSTGLASGTRATVTDINGDGLPDLASLVGTDWRYRTHAAPYPDLLLTATDGFNNFSTFSYTSIVQGNYTKNSGATFPQVDYLQPLQVVSSVVSNDGIGGTFTQSFWYYWARMNLQGRGFEGFYSRQRTDSRTGIHVFQERGQAFPYTGMLTETVVRQPNNVTEISRSTAVLQTHTYGSGFESRALPYVGEVHTTEREVAGTYNGNVIRTSVQEILVDSVTGTPYDTTLTVAEPASGANGVQPGASYVRRVYQPLADLTPDANCLGKPQEIQEINSHNRPYGGTAITRTTELTWDTTKCRVTQVVTEPGHAQLQVTRVIGYDAFGNVNSDTITGIGMPDRATTASWGSTGQFPTSVTNALSQETNLEWNYAFGAPVSQTDPNSLTISWVYDDFGRRIREDRPDGTYMTFEYFVNPVCDPRSKIGVLTTPHTSGGSAITYHYLFLDQLERPIGEYRWSFSMASWDTVIRTYDALGRVATEGMPYSSGGCTHYSPPYVTTFQYDSLNRPTQVSRPTSDSNPALQTATSYYEGLTTRTVDPLSKQATHVVNATGALARSIDHDGYYQTFDYDAFDNVVRVQDSLSNTLQLNTFNIRGMRTQHTDMDAGSRTFTPNALGEITSQIDAKSQNTTFGYDLLGRLTSRVEIEGTSTFTFGTSSTSTPTNKNIGRLIGMSGPGYSENLTYDSIGRLQQRAITSDATYNFNFTYNSQGTLDTLTYPVSTSSYRLKLQYEYQSGQLLRVKDFNAPTTVFWQANATDAWGHVIHETLGNGVQTVRGFDLATGVNDYIQSGVGGGTGLQNLSYTWDAVGNLTQRQNVGLSLTEGFGYDNLHRLTSITGPEPRTIAYNSMGNITSKSSVGTYTYHGTKKHQVTAAGTNTYGYDANGNMNSRNGSAITWYSYDLPNTLNASGSNSSQFFYTPDRSRWKQVASYSGASEQTIYIGGLVEKTTVSSTTRWKHYIVGGSGVVAEYIRPTSGSNETVYLLKDHLGSTEMLTDSSGGQMTRLSFDAWGRRRSGATWTGDPTAGDSTTFKNTTRHGFTSHEMLDNLTVTHMNGRVYDQVLGRFLSADPIVQAPRFTQSFNRYSYTFNSPLSYTDPSGYNADGPIVRSCISECPRYNLTVAGFMAYWTAGTAGLGSGPGIQPNTDLWQQSRGWGNADTLPDSPSNALGPRFESLFPSEAIVRGFGNTVGTTNVANLLDILATPWGGWDNLKYAVRCAWECQMPGDGSLEANLAGVPFIPVVGVEAITARGAAALVGRSFGRLGTIVQNPGIVIRGFDGSKVAGHAINQIINRGVTPELIRATVANPIVVLQQGGNRFLYLTEQAAVVITREGQVVTAWTQREFLPGVLEVLSVVGSR
jgi:RHS repeat-associated protein